MIQELKLVNRDTEGYITNETRFNGSADIDFDSSGNMVRCTGEEGLEQNILKAVLTSTQENGYGTDMFSILGKKNIEFIRGKLMYEILSTFEILRKNQLNYLSQFPTYDKKNIAIRTFNIQSTKKQKTDLGVSLKVQSLDSYLKNKNSLDEVNFLISNE